MILMHPETRYLVMLSVIFVLGIIVAGIISYKVGAYNGYSQAIEEELMDFEKQLKMYEDLLRRYEELERKYKNCRNELCLKCGCYEESHEGACNGCRWEEQEDE